MTDIASIRVPVSGSWSLSHDIDPIQYVCGFCNSTVGSSSGLSSFHTSDCIYFCPCCGLPTFIGSGMQVPSPRYGNFVDHLPGNILSLYNEVRGCMSVNSYTLAVLGCRKLLMNVAVDQGADTNQSFAYYVNYLEQHNYVPSNGRGWVDHIRQRGNEATHEIHTMGRTDAEQLVNFIEMLLRIIYEFPNRIAPQQP